MVAISFYGRLSARISDWHERKLIDDNTRDLLIDDIEKRRSKRSFSSIVALLGIICLCFAAMSFVAANWDEMSSRFRVILLGLTLWISYGLAIYFYFKNNHTLAHAFILLGCGLFGANIMLLGQIYHLSGEPVDAVWLWGMGTMFMALGTRSIPALVLAITLFVVWTLMMTFEHDIGFNWRYLILWSMGTIFSWQLKSRIGAHASMIGLLIWGGVTLAWFAIDQHNGFAPVTGLTIGLCAISALLLSHNTKRYLSGFEAHAIGYLFMFSGACVVIWFFEQTEVPGELDQQFLPILLGAMVVITGLLAIFGWRQKLNCAYDQLWSFIWASLAVAMMYFGEYVDLLVFEAFWLALTIWTIRLGLREDLPNVTKLGYLGFGTVMLLIYFQTAGTLLGTTGFYLSAGLLLVIGGLVLPKIFKAIAPKTAEKLS